MSLLCSKSNGALRAILSSSAKPLNTPNPCAVTDTTRCSVAPSFRIPSYHLSGPQHARSQMCATQSSHSHARPSRCRLYSTQARGFSSTRHWSKAKTLQEVQSRNQSGPFSWRAGVLFMVTGAGMIVYFRSEKARMERKRIAEATKGIGKPKVGGEFDLVDHNGNKFTSKDMLGKYALVYFGFTHCPDICPEELDKMAVMYDLAKAKSGNVIRPIVVTCDPARDKPAVLKRYLEEFHPEFLGLTGTWDQIKDVCKAYRVYFSTPPDVQPGQDYLVDHSIYFYLMDPEGDFVEALGRNFTAEQAAKIIADHIGDWKGRLDKS